MSENQLEPGHFVAAFAHVLEVEGGYTDNPFDGGGATKYGITQNILRAYTDKDVSKEDVRALSIDMARDIYWKFFWVPHRLSKIKHRAVAIALFDQIVNCGSSKAIKRMQTLLSSYSPSHPIDIDGRIGDITISALNDWLYPNRLVLAFFKLTQEYYVNIIKKNPSQLCFLEGWLLKRSHRLLGLVEV